MNINVPDFARSHFWEEPPLGSMEFWAFRFRPPCEMGDELIFKFNGQIVARAKVAFIEGPGTSRCRATGKYENRWKVFWSPESFEDARTSSETIPPGPLFAPTPRTAPPETRIKKEQADD